MSAGEGARADAPADRGPEALDRLAREGMASGAFAGAVARIERRGEPVFEGAWGNALDAAGEREAMATSSVFDLASVSKLFTTTAILSLATRGDIDLDAGIAETLGYGGELARALAGADLRALLSHSSGLHYWYPFYARRGEAFEAILERVIAEHPRRKEVIYSDLNFMLLGKVVERATGMGLREAERALVSGPLGLGAGYGSPASGVVATEFGNRIERQMVDELGLSFGGWREESRPIRGEPDDGNCHYYFGGAAGHAGIFGDAAALARLGGFYLDGGKPPVGGIISPTLMAEARRDHGGGRGLGFMLGENFPGGGFGHSGFTGTYLHVNDAAGLVIVLLTNRLHVPSPRRINDYYQSASRIALEAWGA
jgi:CubicO group peptidase (beta-lactamase class C family)